jgi:hypothetical protein
MDQNELKAFIQSYAIAGGSSQKKEPVQSEVLLDAADDDVF